MADRKVIVLNSSGYQELLQSSDKLILDAASEFKSNVHIDGNLTVTGTSVTFDTVTLSVDDINIELGAIKEVHNVAVTPENLAYTLSDGSNSVTTSALGASPTIATLVTAIEAASGYSSLDFTVTANINNNGIHLTYKTLGAQSESATLTKAGGSPISASAVTNVTDATANGGGFTLYGSTPKTFNWVSSTGSWTSSENIDLASGKDYKINGTSVLTNNTLGSGVTGSSLTSVGTIATGVWNGTAIALAYGGTGYSSYSNGQLLIGKADGTLAKAFLTQGTNTVITNGDGSIEIVAKDTTYTISAEQTGGSDVDPDIKITAGGNGSTVASTVALVGGGGTTVTRNSASQITISSAGDQSISATQTGDRVDIALSNNGGYVTLTGGTATTITRTSASEITIAGQDTTYSAATTSAAGLMSATDKTQLDALHAGSNVNYLRSNASDDFTGTLAHNNPGGLALYVRGGDSDTTLLRVSSQAADGTTTDTSGLNGFSLIYTGTGSNNNNSLDLYSDNQSAQAQTHVYSVTQDGVLDFKVAPTISSNAVLTSATTFGGDVSGTYNAIVVADNSHDHTIANITSLASTLVGKYATSGGTLSGQVTIDAGQTAQPLVIEGSANEKIALKEALEPRIVFYENTTEKAHLKWNSIGYLELKNAEDASVLRVKDALAFSMDGSTFYDVFHSGIDVNLSDSNKIKLGTGDDLQIYHDGQYSTIKNTASGPPLAVISDTGVDFKNSSNTTFFDCSGSGGYEHVALKYGGSTKLSTVSAGVYVQGALTATNGVTPGGNITMQDDEKIVMGAASDLQIYHDATDDVIHSIGTSLRTRSNIFRANNAANTQVMFRAFSGGAFEAYHAGTKRVETISSGAVVTGKLGINKTNPTHCLGLEGTANDTDSELQITASSVASGYLGCNSDGLNIGTDTAGVVFKTGVTGGGSVGGTGTERFRIGSSGQIGIGGANYGTSGQVLTSNGAQAAPSWQGVTATSLDGQSSSYYLDYGNFTNTPTIPTNNNQLTNGAGYITSFDITTQTDSKYLRSDAADTATGTITISGLGNSLIAQHDVTSGNWSGRIISKNATLDCAAFLASYNGFPGLYAHNNALNAWHDVFINSHGTGAGQASVYLGTSYINGNIAWHAGNDGAGSLLDADKLDSQEGSYYLNYNNFTNTPTIPTNNNQLTNGANYVSADDVGVLNNVTHTSDGQYDVTLFGAKDGAAQSGNFSSKLALKGGGSQTRDLQLSQDYSGYATISTSWTSNYLDITSFNRVRFNQQAYVGNNTQLWNASGEIQNLGGQAASAYLRSNANDSFSGDLTGSGTIYTTGTYMGIKGDGGGVVLTTNDGYGNANVCFNHKDGIPDAAGSSCRIETSVDNATGFFLFEIGNSVTANQAVSLTETLKLTTSAITWKGETVWHAGNDGIGSLLDADKLDSQEGSYYLDYGNFTNTPTIPTNNNQLTNGAGYISSFDITTQTDSKYLRSDAADISTGATLEIRGGTAANEAQIKIDASNAGHPQIGFGDERDNTGDNYWAIGADDTDVSYFKFATRNSTGIPVVGGNTSAQVKFTIEYDGNLWAGPQDVNKIWHAGNDGIGSLLDADKLDSQEGSYYLDYGNFTNTPTIPTNNNQLTNGAGYLTSFDITTQTDGKYLRSNADDTITKGSTWVLNQNIADWAFRFNNGNATNGNVYMCHGTHGMHIRNDSSTTSTYLLDVYASNGNRFRVRGADAYVTINGNAAWHAGNDGPSSTLNADLLDNEEGSYYLDYANFTNTPTIPSISGLAALSGATFTGDLRVDNDADLRIGDGAANERILIQKADNNVSDHIIFYNGTTRVGEIGCEDTTWLRINQETSKNIYTPRYIRADGGFFVDGTSKGINGSGNFFGGTIAGASDANVANWNTAHGWGDHSTAGYLTSFDITTQTDSKYIRSNADDDVSAHTEWQDNKEVRLGAGADFRMWFNGTDTFFRNYAHTGGDVHFQGEDSAGNNENAMILDFSGGSSYVRLFQASGERLRTLSGGVGVTGLTVGDVDANPHNTNGVFVSNGTDEKIVLSGSSQPYIRWQENTTDKAYIRWSTGGHLDFRNQETGAFKFQSTVDGQSAQLILLRQDTTTDSGNDLGSINFGHTDGDPDFPSQTASQLPARIVAEATETTGTGDDGARLRFFVKATNADKATDSVEALRLDQNRSATFYNDLYVPDQIFHSGDTNTYTQFHAADQWRVVTGGTERLEVNSTAVTVAGVLNVRNAIDLADNDILRLGSGDDAELFCNGSHLYLDLNSGIGNFYIRDGTTTRYTFDDNGSFTATGNVTAYSDITLKKNIQLIPDALEKLLSLRGVIYDRIDLEGEANQRQSGVIAQEVEPILPEVVDTDENGIKSVAYGNMVGLLIEAIKEQQQQIDELKAKLL